MYISTGKVGEAQALLRLINKELKQNGESSCCMVVFNAELTPGQQRVPKNAFNCKVIKNDFLAGADNNEVVKVVGWTALILNIFAHYARTREGKLQVNKYRKPHLKKMWTHLEWQSGSGGALWDWILVLRDKIDMVQRQRDLHQRGRKRGGLLVLALVGYTNAGKLTLVNCLTAFYSQH
jgi:GTP-binding protein HflX